MKMSDAISASSRVRPDGKEPARILPRRHTDAQKMVPRLRHREPESVAAVRDDTDSPDPLNRPVVSDTVPHTVDLSTVAPELRLKVLKLLRNWKPKAESP